MNSDEKFDQFLHSINSELQARTGNPNLTHQDFEEFNFSFEFEIGATVAETVSEVLVQHKRATNNFTPLC